MNSNLRISRLAAPDDDEALDAMIERRAVPIDLGRDSPLADATRFEEQAKKIFLSDPQIRYLLRALLSVGRAHAEFHLGDDKEYLRKLQGMHDSPWGKQHSCAICLTGLAGIGKSELLEALGRLIGMPLFVTEGGIRDLPLVTYWLLSARGGAGLNALLETHLNVRTEIATLSQPDQGVIQVQNKAPKRPLENARWRTWRDSVCIIAVDEFQSITSSSDANAKATGLLINLISIGPRLVFCANFSLVHKLMKRNQEDRHRLLQHPLVMLPMKSGTESWIRYLDELKAIAPKVFVFESALVEREVHSCTSGIKRNVVSLLKWAYVAARKKGGNAKVEIAELRAAFRSGDYSQNRIDVENLTQQEITHKKTQTDLWCPFDVAGGASEAADEPSKVDAATASVTTATAAVEGYERRVHDQLIASSLSSNEAKALKSLTPPAATIRPAGVTRLPRAGAATLKDLIDGAKAIDDL